jgi:hypothetical protein
MSYWRTDSKESSSRTQTGLFQKFMPAAPLSVHSDRASQASDSPTLFKTVSALSVIILLGRPTSSRAKG